MIGWLITATGSRVTADGWTATWQVPTFMIPYAVHGCTRRDTALEIAHEILAHGRADTSFAIHAEPIG